MVGGIFVFSLENERNGLGKEQNSLVYSFSADPTILKEK